MSPLARDVSQARANVAHFEAIIEALPSGGEGTQKAKQELAYWKGAYAAFVSVEQGLNCDGMRYFGNRTD